MTQWTPELIEAVRSRITSIRAAREQQDALLKLLEDQMKLAEHGINPEEVAAIQQHSKYRAGHRTFFDEIASVRLKDGSTIELKPRIPHTFDKGKA